jgi:GNAT superfamily N-acetyltransferase
MALPFFGTKRYYGVNGQESSNWRLAMTVLIRKANGSDAVALSEMFFEFIGISSDINKMQNQLEFISQQPNYFVAVACVNDVVLGTAMGIICHDLVGNCSPFLLVENVVVSRKSRGQGLGKVLMNSLEDFAKDNNCNYIMLASSNERNEAHLFYESLGYEGAKRGFIKRLSKQI